MKKLLMFAVVSVMTLGASATNYVVISNDDLKADEVQIPYNYYGWWQDKLETVDDAASPEAKALKFSAANSGAAFSGGWHYPNGEFKLATIADYDLVFYAKAEGSAKWVVRLTGEDTGFTTGDVDCTISVPSDGEYHQVRLNLPTDLAKASASWKEHNAGYIFALVADNASSDAALYLADVHYESAVPMPEITASVSDVTSTGAVLSYTVNFPQGYTDTKVTINGETAAASPVTLTGLTPHTEYTYIIQAVGSYQGAAYTAESVVKFTTARELGDVPVWYDRVEGRVTQYGKDYDISIDYSIAYNADKTLTVLAHIEGTDGIVGLANRQISFIRGLVEEWAFMTAEGEDYVYQTTKTVEDGTEVEFFFWLPFAEGVFGGDYHKTYVAGSANEKPVIAPRLTASAENVTYNSADIVYTVTVPAALQAADLKVYFDGKEASASPIALTGLTEKTEYSYELYAVATLDGTEYTSRTVTVSFKTPSEVATEKVFNDYVKAEFKNAYLVGEDASKARTMYMSLPFKLTYSTQGTLKYEIDLSQCYNIVGLAPQIYWNGFKTLTEGADHVWSYDFGALEEDSKITISHYLAYAGGVVDINFGALYPNVGGEKDAFEIGEAANLKMSAAKTLVCAKEPVYISVSATDKDGYYLPAGDVEFEVPEYAHIENGYLTIDVKQPATVVAKCGSLTTQTVVTCGYSPESTNVTTGNADITYATDEEWLIEGTTAANAFDGNLGTELRWGCGTTEEHYLHVDLGKDLYIETVDLTWEGAYATEYTVTLSNTNPMAPATRGAADEVVLNGPGNGTKYIAVLDPAGTHRYLSVKTSKALNAGWGIKIKELAVYGAEVQPSISTGVSNVAYPAADLNADGLVDVYTMTGIRVLKSTTRQDAERTLAPGLYIMGGKKVIIR